MKRLLWLLLLLVFLPKAHSQTCPVAAGTSWSSIKTIITACASGSTVTFAAGTYTGVNSTVTIPCGVSLSGPVVPYSQTHYQTAILQESGGITQPLHTTATCSASQSISYLEWNGEQSSAGGGFIYVTPGTQNLTIDHNWVHGMFTSSQYPGCCASVGVMFAGGPTSPLTQNDTVTMDEFGPEVVGQDCGVAMQATSTSSGGGFCAGWASEGQLNNVSIDHNIFHNLEQAAKVAEACTSTSTPHCPGGTNASNGNTQNFTMSYNWFYNIQRIPFETQSNTYDTTHPTLQYVQYNSLGNRNGDNATGNGTGQQNFDLSIANGCGNPPSTDNCASHVDYNVDVQNIGNTHHGAGYEHWGSSSTTGNYNLTELNYQNAGGAFIWSPSGSFTYNNNTFNINTTASTSTSCVTGGNSFWNHQQSPAGTPSCSGNSLSNVGSGTYPSNAATISPTGGAVSSGTVLTISAVGSNRDANTSAWCTTDGTTPVPGSGTAKIMTSYTVNSAVTVKCVGMWGAINQPYSYPSGYGYVPSTTNSQAYTIGGVTLTSITIACSPTTLNPTQGATCTAQCFYSNSTNDACTTTDAHGNQATWSSSNTAVGTITSPGGSFSALAVGSTNIAASVSPITSSNQLMQVVNPTAAVGAIGKRTNWIR